MKIESGQKYVPKPGEQLMPITVLDVIVNNGRVLDVVCKTDTGHVLHKHPDVLEERYEAMDPEPQPPVLRTVFPVSHLSVVTPKKGQVWRGKKGFHNRKASYDLLVMNVGVDLDGQQKVQVHKLAPRPLRDRWISVVHLIGCYTMVSDSLAEYHSQGEPTPPSTPTPPKEQPDREDEDEASDEGESHAVSAEMAARFGEAFRETTEEVMRAATESFLDEMRQGLSGAFTGALDDALDRAVRKAVDEAMAPYSEALMSLVGGDE